jgi:hypothetical protein
LTALVGRRREVVLWRLFLSEPAVVDDAGSRRTYIFAY